MPERERRLGKKFEIWVEHLLRANGYRVVRCDVEYHRSRCQFRQVDLEYFSFLSLAEHFVILELKYSSNGSVQLPLRSGSRTKAGQLIRNIDNIVTEMEERRRFVKADTAVLVTNQSFDEGVHNKARRYGIRLWERDRLEELLSKRRRLFGSGLLGNEPIEQQVEGIDLRKYGHRTHIVYI